MSGSVVQTYMSDILHAITQGLLVPDIVLLIAFIAYALFCIGSIVAEFFSERKHFEVAMPKFLAALMAAEEDEIPSVIEESGLLKRQKIALLTVYDYRILPGDALVALIKRLVGEEESRYDRISGRNNMAARVSPMLGLMGTLIPLGPGIQALGQADTAALSASLLIAFDTTVAGLVVAAVCMIVGKIRGNWYANYMSALDSAMATMLQKIEDMRAEGKIVTEKPSDYAFMFEQSSAHAPHDKENPALGAIDALRSRKSDAPGMGAPAAGADARASSYPADTANPRGAAQAASATMPLGTPSFSDGVGRGQQAGAINAASGPVSSGSAFAPANQPNRTDGNVDRFHMTPSAYPQTASLETRAHTTGVVDSAKPLTARASFEPVPDPSFISDLANAQASMAAGAQQGAGAAAQTMQGRGSATFQHDAAMGSPAGPAGSSGPAGSAQYQPWGANGSAASRNSTDKPAS